MAQGNIQYMTVLTPNMIRTQARETRHKDKTEQSVRALSQNQEID